MSTETTPGSSWPEIVRTRFRRIRDVIATRYELDFRIDQELAPIASELSMGVAELREHARRGRHAARELPEMMTALGMDAAVIAHGNPRVILELQRVCASCHCKARCRRALASGRAAANWETFCPNRMTLRAMQ